MNEEYCGLLLFSQNFDMAGRGIAGPRLRTAADRAGFNVKVIDYINHISLDQIYQLIDILVTDKTKFIGLSVSWIDDTNWSNHPWYRQDFFDTIRKKHPKILIITGGHDEFKKDFLLKNSNYHFHGYSDNSFVEFLKMIHGQDHNLQYYRNPLTKGYIINSNISHPVENPDDLETIFFKEDNIKPYQPMPIEVARGCIFRCGFCRHPFQGKKDYDSYQRSVGSLASELKRNYELFGTTRYTVLDDTFNDSIEKISRLQQAVKNSGIPKFEFVSYIKPELLVTKPEMIQMLADLGLRGAFIGIESFNQENRKAIGKGTNIVKVLDACQKLSEVNNRQVLIHAGFIVGLPYDTKESLEKTLQFLLSNNNTMFKSFHSQPLSINGSGRFNPPVAEDSMSLMDKDPSKYGYKFQKGGHWYNDYWSVWDAIAFSMRFNLASDKVARAGGWQVAAAWQIDTADSDLNHQHWPKSKWAGLLKAEAIKRAAEDFNNIISKKK